jgi:transcriptional regulator with XRE-family HTH domain
MMNFVKALSLNRIHRGRMSVVDMTPNANRRSLEAIAWRLRATREALGFKKQKDFAEQAGISPNTYNQWEKAKVYPDLQYMIRIRDQYGISLDWIYLGDPSGLPYQIARLLKEEVLQD